ncbi:MAG TPA: hypothetical protein VFU40_11500, partial [Gemmatimonadales bacterium]|nr:hypothetical protein [Gemmatimonadales bacterium]
MLAVVRSVAASIPLLWVVMVSTPVFAQPAAAQPAPSTAPPSFRVLADQVVDLFPIVHAEVVELADGRVTLTGGRAQGLVPGIELVVVREGRELLHPTTREVLGRVEQTLGRVVVTEVSEQYAVAKLVSGDGAAIQPGDKARVPSGKVRLAVVALAANRTKMIEAAASELLQELERRGRFQIAFGDHVAVWVAQQNITPEDFMAGRGVREAAARFKFPHLMAVHFTTVQGRLFMDVRLFSEALDAPRLQNALFVPSSVRPAQTFSAGPSNQPQKAERRSLLTRLLSGDWEPNTYSAGAGAIPLRSLATFPFRIVSMDVAVGPQDKVPRVALTDGERVFVYRIRGEKLEPEWTYDKRMLGKILSVQLADLNGDNVLDVVVNRQDFKSGMLSYILTTRQGRAAVLADDIPLLLLAVDEQGEGLNRALWGQVYNTQNFWTRGTATRYVVKDGKVDAAGRVSVHDAFRPTGATFSNVGGKERVLAFVDEDNHLRIALGGQELWRSNTVVGGGLTQGHLQLFVHQTNVDYFFKWEPNPLSVDLDGDGVHEVVVPVNEGEAGRLGVVFRGPTGFRIQVVNSGFEGFITGLGAVPGEGGPSLLAAVLRRTGIFRQGGETQLIITV